MSQTRVQWGVLFAARASEHPTDPLFCGWHPDWKPSYPDAPIPLMLFTSRRGAREFCARKNEEWKRRPDNVRHWRLRPVKVRESWAVVK